jgi:glycosyltransferase involved in cell wall biosynthesis
MPPDSRSVPVKISIGILAHDEEERVGGTLSSLFGQDLFGQFETEIVVIPNGCSDGTAAAARTSIKASRAVWSALGTARVEELAAAGKANAWNEFVHRLSSRDADILILMDADISLPARDTLSKLVRTLMGSSDAVVCVDQPVKSIEPGSSATLLQRVLASSTPPIDPRDIPICGQLYCAYSSELRRIWLPRDIQVDDGFIRAMLLTRCFTAPEDRSRIVLAPNTYHRFTSVATIRELFKHERWLVAGSIVNMLLFGLLHAEARPDYDAGKLIEEWSQRDPDWLPKYVAEQVQARGFRLLPSSWWTRRWTRLGYLPLPQRLARVPTAAAASIADAIVFVAAILYVREGKGFRYWRGR